MAHLGQWMRGLVLYVVCQHNSSSIISVFYGTDQSNALVIMNALIDKGVIEVNVVEDCFPPPTPRLSSLVL